MVASGKLQLHDSIRPALTADTYRVDLATDSDSGQFGVTRWLSIESPRYRLEEIDLVSVFPMTGARGDFNEQLPWVALRRRTLPWERRGASADAASPWLALVVTQRNEATLGSALLASVVGATAAARFQPPQAGQVSALQFTSVGELQSIVPSEADARLLCHVREVNQADTELAGSDDDGFLAVVIANRLLSAQIETTWRVTLVSLENRDDLAAGAPETASLLALASWECTTTGDGSFQTLVTSLDRTAFAAQPTRLSHTTDDGTVHDVAYRSPLTAADPTAADPEISRLAASELGRLIAAADGRLLRELIQWRRSDAVSADRAITASVLRRSSAAISRSLAGETRAPMHLRAALDALHSVTRRALPQIAAVSHARFKR
jgi:hypothetical protein